MTLPIVLAIVLFILVFAIGLYAVSGSSGGSEKSSGPRLFRACPICNHELKIGENILAERTGMVREGREKIVIKGCHYCLGKDRF